MAASLISPGRKQTGKMGLSLHHNVQALTEHPGKLLFFFFSRPVKVLPIEKKKKRLLFHHDLAQCKFIL